MSQTWTANVYDGAHTAATDLQNIEDNFASLQSMFSGAAAPAAVPGKPWFDTTNKILKIRNNADSAWLGVMYGSSSNKIWIYANAATDGWTIDGTVTDRVLALKGGATYTTGGATAGSWTQPTHTHTGPSHTHSVPALDLDKASASSIQLQDWYAVEDGEYIRITSPGSGTYNKIKHITVTGTSGAGGTGATGAGSPAITWRPAAAVGTMQYPTI